MSGTARGALRIGIDGRTLEPPRTGVGRTVFELCRALHDRLPDDTRFFVYARRPVELPVSSPRWAMRTEPVAAFARLPASAWLKLRAGTAAASDALDVFWAAGALAPGPRWRGATVATVYDLTHLVAPDTMPAGLRLFQRLFFAADLRRASGIVAISHGTADRLAAQLGIVADRVVPPAAAPAFRRPSSDELLRVRARLGLERSYFLSVATREPRKNLTLLVDAYQRARATDRTGSVAAHDLVLVGAGGWGEVRLASVPGVRELGYVDDALLPALYGGATAFVFPSRYEGYGMPVLEARRCGAQVIASDTAEIREAGGASGVTYVAPALGPLVDALIRAATHAPPPPALAVARDTAPSWDDAARAYADLFARAAGCAPTCARTADVRASASALDATVGAPTTSH